MYAATPQPSAQTELRLRRLSKGYASAAEPPPAATEAACHGVEITARSYLCMRESITCNHIIRTTEIKRKGIPVTHSHLSAR
jgi:hypothetical protein